MAVANKEARASIRIIRVTPNKARFVLNQIRGLPVPEAERVLAFSNRDVARDILKIVRSASANAGLVLNAEADELKVSRCWADEGPTLKRFRPRAQGRAYRIRKRTCSITVCVEATT